jgi:small subunit ribosomal protein S1
MTNDDFKQDPTPDPKPSPAAPMSDYEGTMKSLTAGQILSGLIMRLDEHGALVDVGMKSEGLIPESELGDRLTPEGKPLAVGERIDVFVLQPEDEDGNPILSKKRADYEAHWTKLIRAFEQGEILTAMIMERVRGGLVADLGVRAFIPASQVSVRNVHALDGLVGRSVKLKILEVDKERKRVVASQKLATEELREKKRHATLANLTEGQVRGGVVRRIAEYGAFVDLGGVDGLLHITEMSWSYISHPGDVLKVGENIDVMVLKIDKERDRISLGLKQILADPWDEVGRKYQVGDAVTGKITRVVAAGAFFRLPEGIEGIIPNAELSEDRNSRPSEETLLAGEITAKIINIRPAERRLTLSLRQAHNEAENKEIRAFISGQSSNLVTIGEILGDAFNKGREEAASAETPDEATGGDDWEPYAEGPSCEGEAPKEA